jgi:hypothetical protein
MRCSLFGEGRPEHAAELARLIPGARLLVLPAGHGDYLGEAVAAPAETRQPGLTAQLIEQFLDDPGRNGLGGGPDPGR